MRAERLEHNIDQLTDLVGKAQSEMASRARLGKLRSLSNTGLGALMTVIL